MSFLNIQYNENAEIAFHANLYKFQDTLKYLIKSYDDQWQYHDVYDMSLIFKNNQCDFLTFTLDENFQHFSVLLETNKYKPSQVDILKENIDVNEFKWNYYNDKKYLASIILDLQIQANERALNDFRKKYSYSNSAFSWKRNI
jgi:hypothetical protein